MTTAEINNLCKRTPILEIMTVADDLSGLGMLFVIATIVSLMLSWTVYQIFFSPLASFPGPRLWAVSRIPWAWHVIRGDLWHVMERMHVKYGPCVRVAPDELTTTVPSAWTELFNSSPLPAKDPKSSTPPPMGIHSLFTASGDTHRRLRAVFVNGFSSKALRGQSSTVEEYAAEFLDRLGREMRHSNEIELTRLFGYFAFDIITHLTYGESIHGLRNFCHHSWIQRYYLQAKVATFRNLTSHFPPLDWLFDTVLNRLTADQRMKNFNEVRSKIEHRLELGKTEGDDRQDLLSAVIGRVSEAPLKDHVTKNELVVHAFSTVVVNSQAATLVLASATYLLLSNPRAQSRLCQEIEHQHFASSKAITVEKMNDMPYLDAVINESLRAHHPTPMTLPRVIPAGGRYIMGRYLPPGVVVGINLHNVQNSRENWVQPDRFCPERFLPESHEYYEPTFDGDDKDAFHPFSMGPRNCLGGRLFFAQTRVLLCRLLYAYGLTLAADANAQEWCRRKAHLVFEPRELLVKLQKLPGRT